MKSSPSGRSRCRSSVSPDAPEALLLCVFGSSVDLIVRHLFAGFGLNRFQNCDDGVLPSHTESRSQDIVSLKDKSLTAFDKPSRRFNSICCGTEGFQDPLSLFMLQPVCRHLRLFLICLSTHFNFNLINLILSLLFMFHF